MTALYWVRHGPTHEKAFVGQRDVPADLSDTEALARLDAFLPEDAVIVSSDLGRCVATADAIAAGRQRLPHRPGLREFDFGVWDGMHWRDVAEGWPELSRQYWEAPGDIAPPGGESWNAAAARINADVDRLLQEAAGQPLIVVAHFGVILTQVQRALGVTPEQAMSHGIDNLSVTEIGVAGTWQARRINHLP